MLPKQWILRHVDLREQMALASHLAISSLTASVLLARGISAKAQADYWLSPHLGMTHDPFLIPDIEHAVDRLHRAVQTGERICFTATTMSMACRPRACTWYFSAALARM